MNAVHEAKLRLLDSEVVPPTGSIHGIDLSTPKSHPRVSFPYPSVTPFMREIGRDLNQNATAKRQLFAEAMGKAEADVKVNEPVDVSSSPKGKCMVTTLVYSRKGVLLASNSHAGSHADQPGHWGVEGEEFDRRQYTGHATLLDLTGYLDARNPVITRDLLTRALHDAHINPDLLKRLLLRTYDKAPAQWEGVFAHLHPDAANFLGQLPHLQLVGIDTPSIDHPNASPIIEKSHGGLWAGRVAILEGLNPDNLPKGTHQGVLKTALQTYTVSIDAVRDAKYASPLFYPTGAAEK